MQISVRDNRQGSFERLEHLKASLQEVNTERDVHNKEPKQTVLQQWTLLFREITPGKGGEWAAITTKAGGGERGGT